MCNLFVCRRFLSVLTVLAVSPLIWPQYAQSQVPSKSAQRPGTSLKVPMPPDDVPADLNKDGRLDRLVTLHEVGTPFNGLLEKISASNLSLKVKKDTAEQKLHLNIKQRSVRQLMQSLTTLLDGDWYALPDASGYRFERDSKAIRRQKRWWQLFLTEREYAFSKMRATVLAAMRTPLRPPAKFVTNHEVEDGIDEATWRKRADEMAVFNALPAALQERIANQIDELPWYGLRGTVRASTMDENAVVIDLNTLPDSLRRQFGGTTDAPGGDQGLNTRDFVTFINFGNAVNATVVSLDGSRIREAASFDFPLTSDSIPMRLNQSDLPVEVKKRGKSAPPNWRELAAYQVSRVWANDAPPPAPPREAPNRIEMQEWLAETQGLEFVSDYYTAFRGVTDFKVDKLTGSLKAELDWQAIAQDISWKRLEGSGIYLFRNNRWYRDDLLEIPVPILKRWIGYKKNVIERQLQWEKARITPTTQMWRDLFRSEFDALADAVYALTPWQLFNGLGNVVVPQDDIPLSPMEQMVAKADADNNRRARPRIAFYYDIFGILFNYRTLLFYGSLDRDQRSALFDGRLDPNALTPVQSQQAFQLLHILQVSPLPERAAVRIGIRPMPGAFTGMPRYRLWLSSPVPQESRN